MTPVIGSRFTGRNELVRNTLSGEYGESLPAISGYALMLQQALLSAPRRAEPRRPISHIFLLKSNV